MADSTTWLDTIAVAQSSKETTANELFDAGSPGTLFGRHASACSGLTWGYYGGRLWDGSAAASIANGTLTLANNATNYVESTSAGVVSSNTSAFTAGRIRIAKVVTSSGAVSSYEDHRTYAPGAGAAGAGTVTSVATGTGLTGGTITTTGTVAFASVSDLRVLANVSGGAAAPTANTLSAILDAIMSSTQGTILYRGSSAWAALAVGTSGQDLQTQGAGANPQWHSQPFDVATFIAGVPTNSQLGVRVSIPRAISFAGNFSGSYASNVTASTGTATFNVDKAAAGSENTFTTIGTVAFAAGSATATFTTTSGTAKSFAAGDVLRIVCPSSADATLADIAITLSGTR